MDRMERTIDKLIVFAICLAGLALGGWGGTVPLSEGTAGATCVSTALVAVCAGALAEALPDRIRPAAPVLLCATALVSPCGAAFLPLACYDAMRELHRGGFGHAVAAAPGAALAASLDSGRRTSRRRRSPRHPAPRGRCSRRAPTVCSPAWTPCTGCGTT